MAMAKIPRLRSLKRQLKFQMKDTYFEFGGDWSLDFEMIRYDTMRCDAMRCDEAIDTGSLY